MATNGNDTIIFTGSLQQLSTTLTNAYSGYTISIDEEKNVNNSVYDGMGGTDFLIMSNYGDALFIADSAGNQTFNNVEIIIAGDGGDVIDLSSTTLVVNNGVIISGGLGDDILWGNVGDDTINGADGHDILDGGPGHDTLQGETGNDYLSGWTGNDTLEGGEGDDILVGGQGNDIYVFDNLGGNDTIIETADSEINTIQFTNATNASDLNFSANGNDMIIDLGVNGTITIQDQFAGNGSGIDTITFSNGSTFDLRSVPKPNVEPDAQDDSFSGNEDTAITGNVLGNDSDSDGGTVSAVAGTFTTANGGTVELLENGDFTYTPAADFFGQDSFDYTITDGQGGSDTASVTLDVASVNDDPTAGNDSFSGNEDTAITGNVLGNDSDSDGGTVSAVAGTFTTANGGTVELLENGDFTYTPAADFFGQDSFDYTITDGQGGSDTASVTLDVASVNDDPTAGNDSFSGNEDTAITGNVLGNDSDSDGGTVSAVAGTFTTANGGTVELLENGDFTYTPAADFFGQDSFDYTITDGQGGSDTATVTLDIADVIDVDPDQDVYGNEGEADLLQGGDGNDTIYYNVDAKWSGGYTAKNVGSIQDEGTGQKVSVKNYNRTYDQFEGGDGEDTLQMTDGNDALFLDDMFSPRPDGTSDGRVGDIEIIRAGGGNDIVDLTSNQYDYIDVTIYGEEGNDHLWASSGDDFLYGGEGKDSLYGGIGNDLLDGGEGKDTLMGGIGNDHLIGGNGNDILYGGNNDAPLEVDKDFNDDVMFPELKERQDIRDLNPSGAASLGIKDPNLNVDFDATATLTFRKGFAGYNNSLGIYNIAEDGTIQMASLLWENVKDAGVNTAHQIDIPGAGDFGFFIIADGDRVNGGYNNLDTSGEGNISFVFDYGGANERAATIYDNGNNISVVYNDGATETVLGGYVYHTTERGADASLNADGEVHAVSGLANHGDDNVLKIGFEDLRGLGDADFEDVLFELDINPIYVDYSENGNDILDGGHGNDVLYGEGGDDILIGGQGNDTLYGGSGSDTFVFSVDNGTDTIKDFSLAENDKLDISEILQGYDDMTSDLDDYIQLVVDQQNAETYLKVNCDGQGGDFKTIAVLEGVVLTDGLDTLVNNGTLIVDQNTMI